MSFRTQGLLLSSALALGAMACGGQSQPANSTPDSVTSQTSSADEPSTASGVSGQASPQAGSAQDDSTSNSMQGGSDRTQSATGSSDSTSSDTMGAGASSTNTAPLNDQQIAKITDSVNSAEIEQAKLAQQKSKNQQVRQFASMMIQHHGQAKKDQAALKLTPEDSPLAQQLAGESQSTLETLKAKQGADFDRAYIDAQIQGHQKVLQALQRELEPAAQNPDLRAYLQKLEPRVADHLAQAQSTQQSLQSSNENSRSSTTASTP